MIEEIVKLTEKERQKIFSRNRGINPGDYFQTDSGVVKVIHSDKKNNYYVLRNSENELEFWDKGEFEGIERLNNTHFQTLKRDWLEKHLFPSSPEALEKYLYNVLLSIYNEEHFEIKKEYGDVFQITLWYPEITITNTIEASHKLYDLYFRCKVREKDRKIIKRNGR